LDYVSLSLKESNPECAANINSELLVNCLCDQEVLTALSKVIKRRIDNSK